MLTRTPLYKSTDVCQITGLSYRVVHYLAEAVGLGTPGQGRPLRWTPTQIVRVWALSQLIRAGIDRPDATAIVAELGPGARYLVVPPHRADTWSTDSALDVVDLLLDADGRADGTTLVVTIPEKLRNLVPLVAQRPVTP